MFLEIRQEEVFLFLNFPIKSNEQKYKTRGVDNRKKKDLQKGEKSTKKERFSQFLFVCYKLENLDFTKTIS